MTYFTDVFCRQPIINTSHYVRVGGINTTAYTAVNFVATRCPFSPSLPPLRSDSHKLRWVVLALCIELLVAWSTGVAGYQSGDQGTYVFFCVMTLVIAITIAGARTSFDDTVRTPVKEKISCLSFSSPYSFLFIPHPSHCPNYMFSSIFPSRDISAPPSECQQCCPDKVRTNNELTCQRNSPRRSNRFSAFLLSR